MGSKKDATAKKRSPNQRSPTLTPQNSNSWPNEASKSLSSRKLSWAVALGFVLGWGISSMFSLISQTDADLRHSIAAYDRAVNHMPNLPKCDDGKTASTKDGNDFQKNKKEPEGRVDNNESEKAVKSNVTLNDATIKTPGQNTENEPLLEGKETAATPKVQGESASNITTPDDDTAPADESNPVSPQDVIEIPKYDRIFVPYDYDGNGVKDFDPNARAVIVSKIHANDTLPTVLQCLCLLTHAYNNRVNYDIVLFASVPISEEELQPIRDAVAPAKFTLVVDNPGLQVMVDALEPERKAHLLKRCNVTNSSELTWMTRCLEVSSSYKTAERTAYNWQAEFRSLHLWTHPALSQYKYMLWLDTDAFSTKVWKQDPIATMIRNDLVLLFDHFPQGASKGTEWPYRFQEAFNKTICKVNIIEGSLVFDEGDCLGKNVRIKQVHGFFHASNLDFYRSEPVKKWSRTLIGDTKFSRMYDDQIGVTMPAAVLAGNRSWDMRGHGLHLDMFHNFLLDGFKERGVGGFVKYWKSIGKQRFPEALEKGRDKCWIHIKG